MHKSFSAQLVQFLTPPLVYLMGFAALYRCLLREMRSRFELKCSPSSIDSVATITVLLFLIFKAMPLPDKFTVAGSPEQVALLLPILEAMYLGFKEVESNNQSVYGLPPGPEFDEWLQLTLHWKGLIVGTKKWHREEKSVRLKGINPRTQGLEYFQALGRKIISKFDNLNFRSGRVKCKYTNWKDGFQTWGYFSSKEVGYHIIETMGDIVNKPIDKKIFKHEGVLDEAGAFDTTPEKVQIAGKLVRPRQRAPIADLKCYKATILFPWVGHVEELCGVNGYLMPNLNFLDAYDN